MKPNQPVKSLVVANSIVLYPTPDNASTSTVPFTVANSDELGAPTCSKAESLFSCSEQRSDKQPGEKTSEAITIDFKQNNKGDAWWCSGTSRLARFFGKILAYFSGERPPHNWSREHAVEKNNDRRSQLIIMRSLFKIRKSKEQQQHQKLLWCFRPINLPSAALNNNGFHQRQQPQSVWITFERKNQILLTQQFEKLQNGLASNDCCKVEDRNICNRNVIATVLLKEGIAFALHPDWSEPATYELTLLPKLTWCQRLHASRQYKTLLKRQQ